MNYEVVVHWIAHVGDKRRAAGVPENIQYTATWVTSRTLLADWIENALNECHPSFSFIVHRCCKNIAAMLFSSRGRQDSAHCARNSQQHHPILSEKLQ